MPADEFSEGRGTNCAKFVEDMDIGPSSALARFKKI